MVRRKSRTLTQGPFPERGEGAPPGGKPPEWWPEWMPWIDIDWWKKAWGDVQRFASEGREPVTGREALTNVSDFLEDWYKKARKSLDERMK